MLPIRQDFLSISVYSSSGSAYYAEVRQQTEYEPRRAAMAVFNSDHSLVSLAGQLQEEHDRRYDSQR